MEGTWATPETPEQKEKLVTMLSQELPVGADATNATEQLYDVLGDDVLFDQLESLADQDANADARQTILDRMQELADDPNVAEVIAQLNVDVDTPAKVDVDAEVSADETGVEQDVEETIDPKNPKDYEIPTYLRKQQGQAPLTIKDIQDKEGKAKAEYQKRLGVGEAENLSPFSEEEELDEVGHAGAACTTGNPPLEEAPEFLSRLKTLSGILAK
jgi:hypothetical protein